MDCSVRQKLYPVWLHGEAEPPSVKDVSVIVLDVALALNCLHQKPRPIIHNDISSANVLLWKRDKQWRAKVSDYGTANIARQSSRNDTGALIYSAPKSRNSEGTINELAARLIC